MPAERIASSAFAGSFRFKFFTALKKTTALLISAMCCVLFFWGGMILRRLNFMCRRFGTLCSILVGRERSMMMEQSDPKRRHIKFQTPENHPKERTHHSRHGESLKSRNAVCFSTFYATCTASFLRILTATQVRSAIISTSEPARYPISRTYNVSGEIYNRSCLIVMCM